MSGGSGSLSNPMQNAQHMQQQQLANAGGMSLPQQLQQGQNAGTGGYGAGMNSPLSPSQQQSMAQDQQNAMFGMGGAGLQGLGGMLGGSSSSDGGGIAYGWCRSWLRRLCLWAA